MMKVWILERGTTAVRRKVCREGSTNAEVARGCQRSARRRHFVIRACLPGSRFLDAKVGDVLSFQSLGKAMCDVDGWDCGTHVALDILTVICRDMRQARIP